MSVPVTDARADALDEELEEDLVVDDAPATVSAGDDLALGGTPIRIEGGERRLAVPDGQVVRRVDRFVADRTGLSRSFVQRLISGGRLVDGDGRRLRANQVVTGGSVVILDVPEPETPHHLEPDPTIPLVVAYEDDDLLIVDKPAGLVVHPAPGHWQGTLVNALLARPGTYGSIAGIARPGIVHRLDRDTSGLLIVAKHDAAQSSLMAQLKARRVKKTYLALVQGSVDAAAGRIEAPIGRDPKDRKRMAVVPNGRPATTGYRVRERFAGWTLLELDLVTGRTHQIRVHLAALGHPVAGDTVYGTGTARKGAAGLERLFLHAWRLELVGPTSGRLIRAEAPLPDELDAVLQRLRDQAGGLGGGAVGIPA
jgi:23S rRNA pseudouridine1911/1915/1917 synthase